MIESLLPIWAVFALALVGVLLAVEFGYRWGCRERDRADGDQEAPVNAMVGATLGLLALLLAFTFGTAADHYHSRKVALLEEANAIRVSHLLAGTIPEPHGAEVRRILREYVDERLRWAGEPVARQGANAKVLLARLSTEVVAAGARNPGTVDAFLASVGRVFELHEMRVMVRERGRIPAGLWFVLILVAVLSLAAMGYHGGIAGRKRSPVMLAVALAFSAVIMLVADLDRPGEGLINVSQQPMLDLRDALAEAKD